jgi:Clathrin light chain
MASSTFQPTVRQDEPEIIKYFLNNLTNRRQWREERNLQIQRREEISQKKKQEVIEQAKQAIDDFYDNYNNTKEKAIAQTRYIILPTI